VEARVEVEDNGKVKVKVKGKEEGGKRQEARINREAVSSKQEEVRIKSGRSVLNER